MMSLDAPHALSRVPIKNNILFILFYFILFYVDVLKEVTILQLITIMFTL